MDRITPFGEILLTAKRRAETVKLAEKPRPPEPAPKLEPICECGDRPVTECPNSEG